MCGDDCTAVLTVPVYERCIGTRMSVPPGQGITVMLSRRPDDWDFVRRIDGRAMHVHSTM